MPLSGRAQVTALFVIFLGAAYLLLFETPLIARVIFVFLCFSWSTWCFIAVLRGPDEVVAASARYALAFASCIGVPLSIGFVLLMSAVPAIQNTITFLATSDGNVLSPSAAGFGLGVTFTVLALCACHCLGLTVWWASKR